MQESSPSSTHTTPSHAPTPTSNAGLASGRDSGHITPVGTGSQKGNTTTKKHKKGVDKEDEDGEAKPPKRLKITYAKGEKANE